MTITETAPSGAAPSTTRTAVGADDQCSWEEWDAMLLKYTRCRKAATDTVRGELYCSEHADMAAGI